LMFAREGGDSWPLLSVTLRMMSGMTESLSKEAAMLGGSVTIPLSSCSAASWSQYLYWDDVYGEQPQIDLLGEVHAE
jgi:hypothetical protein